MGNMFRHKKRRVRSDTPLSVFEAVLVQIFTRRFQVLWIIGQRCVISPVDYYLLR